MWALRVRYFCIEFLRAVSIRSQMIYECMSGERMPYYLSQSFILILCPHVPWVLRDFSSAGFDYPLPSTEDIGGTWPWVCGDQKHFRAKFPNNYTFLYQNLNFSTQNS